MPYPDAGNPLRSGETEGLNIRFTWDEKKRRATLEARRLDFADARKVFAGPTFTWEDKRFDYGEQRFVTLGLLIWGRRSACPHREPGTYPRHLDEEGGER